MNRVTIKDLARRLKVSPSTISRALRDHPDISPQTRAKIKALAEQLNYFPDSIAQSLQKKQTRNIGVIVPEIKHDFFANAISGIEEVAYRAGYSILVSQSNEDYQREKINVRAMASSRVAGLLVSISQTTTDGEHFLALQRMGLPLVFFNRVCEDVPASRVVVDDFKGAYKAVTHLIERGYKKIAHLAGPAHLKGSHNRYSAYRKALNEAGLPLRDEWVVFGGMHEDDGVLGMQRLLNCSQRPDAVFAVNDPVAVGAFMHLREFGLKIPDDVALVGFSNNPLVSLLDPPLTTVDEFPHDLGKEAISLLLEEIDAGRGNLKTRTVELETRLIVRRST